MDLHFVSTSVQRWLSPAGLGAFLATSLLFSGACSPVSSRRTSLSPAAAVSELYEGTLESQEHGELPFSANLRDENGSVAGPLSTPLGDFPFLRKASRRRRSRCGSFWATERWARSRPDGAPGRSADTGS